VKIKAVTQAAVATKEKMLRPIFVFGIVCGI